MNLRKHLKKLIIGACLIIIGTVIIFPVEAHVIGSRDAHTFSGKHAAYYSPRSWVKRYFATRSWVKRYFSTKTWVKTYFYTKSQSDTRYYTKSQSDSRYLLPSEALATYLTQANAASTYVSKSGDTMTGTLNGTTFSGNNFQYQSAQTKSKLYVANEFIPRTDLVLTYTEGGNAFYKASGTDNALSAGVHLPDGAVITEVTLYSYDNSDSGITLSMGRSPLNSASAESVVMSFSSSGSSGSAGYSNTNTPVSGKETIDNDTYFYYLSATITNSSSSLTFRGAKVTYTTTSADGN